ncbi:hypothetical protein P7C70_g3894, partial [Phenoliferia sp. Uapishka_3]
MSSDLVLVTGATGFIGTEVVLAYIEKGFKVRGTARSQAKIAEWEAKYPETKKNLEWAIVKDIVTPGAFDEAIKGVTILAHTASPFHYKVEDNLKDMLLPAIDGTKEALLAAKKTPSVKRVVVTSSFASVLNLAQKDNGKGVTYSHKDWNPATLEEAAKADHPGFVYCASKKLAEEEAWKIAEGASFSLTTVCPPMVFGPPPQVVHDIKSLNTSAEAVWAVVDAKELKPAAFPVWVDVRDIAKIHVLATTEEVAKGQRYLCVAGHYDDTQIADIIIRDFPEQAHRIPKAPVTSGPEHFKTDSSKVEKELNIKWIDFETSIKDTVKTQNADAGPPGYDTGVISAALVNIGTDVGGKVLDSVEKEWCDIIQATVSVSEAFNARHPTMLGRLRAIAQNGSYFRPIIVSSVLFLACQLGGVNSLMYYSGTLFAAAGLKNSNAVSIAVAATNFVSTTLGVIFLDKVGRRRTYLIGAPICIAALCFSSMCFHFMTVSTGGKLDTNLDSGVTYPNNWVIGMIMCLIIYLFGFAPSLGTIPYTSIELLPLEVRSIGTAIGVSWQWIGNIVMSSTFLTIMNKAGPAATFGIYAVVILIALTFVIFCYPGES